MLKILILLIVSVICGIALGKAIVESEEDN